MDVAQEFEFKGHNLRKGAHEHDPQLRSPIPSRAFWPRFHPPPLRISGDIVRVYAEAHMRFNKIFSVPPSRAVPGTARRMHRRCGFQQAL